jgi:hypothetical protein
LKLPDAVANLSAARTGDQVTLHWTMPKKNTDKLLLKGALPVRVCRREGTGACVQVAGGPTFAPGAEGSFTETLTGELAAGAARPLGYFVELENGHGRSAGLSNEAVVLAGAAPAAVEGLKAEVRRSGVVLRWDENGLAAAVRLHRKLLTAPAEAKGKDGIFAPGTEPAEQNLLVEPETDAARTGRALDKTIRFGQVYEYTAQRVMRVEANGATLELAGPISAAIRVEAADVFPPAVPSGLAAVAAVEAGGGVAIDLSWAAVADADLAGYAVYRREGAGTWWQISGARPVVGAAFHDGQVEAGHSYRYAVTSIGQSGHESARSAEAEETVPNP